MAQGTDVFEQRLKRLGSKQPGARPKTTPIDLNAKLVIPEPEPEPEQNRALNGSLVMALGILVFGAGAFGAMLVAPKLIFGGPTAEIVANVDAVVARVDTPAPKQPAPQTATVNNIAPEISAIQPASAAPAASQPSKSALALSAEERVRIVIEEAKRQAQEQARTTLAAVQRTARQPTTLGDDLPLAWTYLPQAPEGWIVVTPEDSPTTFGTGKTQDEKRAVSENHKRDVEAALRRVAARFPGGRDALEAHPNFVRIQDYLSSQPVSRKFRGRRTNKGEVLYVGNDNSFLKITLHFLPAEQALGPMEDRRAWGDGILAQIDDRFGVKGVPTSFMNFHGGVAYGENSNVTRVTQPSIGSKPEVYDMSLALNYRTAIKIIGLAPPETMKRILRSIDTDLIMNRIELMDPPL